MFLPQAAIDLVAAHCDIATRLSAVPPSARVRGIHFRTLENELERFDQRAAYHAIFPPTSRWSVGWRPLKEYLLRIAYAGALAASPEQLHDGMQTLMSNNATEFSKTLLGRTMLRLLARDPIRLSEQAVAVHRQTTNYGHWELIRRGEREIEMVYTNEYVWIESALAGGAVGALKACDVTPTVETRLIDPFNGSTVIRW